MKLQPTYIWTKLSSAEEETQDAFQYYLQREHTVVANAVNATIDDESSFTKERGTAFTWINQKQIWTKSFTGIIVAPGTNSTPHGITGIENLVEAYGTIQDATPLTVEALPIPFSDITAGDSVYIRITPTTYEIDTNTATYNGYTYFLTIRYTKKK